MMSADEARLESKNRKTINCYLDEIEQRIVKAVNEGQFATSINIAIDTSDYVRKAIEDELVNKLGYSIIISDNRGYSGPSDQGPWYDKITISWEENKDGYIQ